MGAPSKPLTMQLGERGAHSGFGSGFGGAIPPHLVQSAPMPAPSSVLNGMFEPAHEMPTSTEALDTITAELTRFLTADDQPAKEMFLAWNEFRERLSLFLSSRKDASRAELEDKIAALTRDGRACLDRIRELSTEVAAAQSAWNAMEETAARLRAVLSSAIAANPDGSGSIDELNESFVMPEEREAWRQRVTKARAELEEQESQMRPMQSITAELAQKIHTQNEKLKGIKEQRRLLRLELQDGVKRVVGSGLQGRVGSTAL